MKGKRKIMLASIVAILGTSAFAQSSANGNMETTAKIERFCKIRVEDVNFGVISSPLTAQSASSKMNILCSNNTNYKVDLNYGGVVSTPSTGTVTSYTLGFYMKQENYTFYNIFSPTGQNIGHIVCPNIYYISQNTVYFSNDAAAKVYGYTKGSWQADTKKVCNYNNGSIASTPNGWQGDYDNNGTYNVVIDGQPGKKFGVMKGTVNGDSLAYKFTIPNDSSKLWSKGEVSYNSIGTGANQEIVVNAQIVVDSSSSKYLAQDTYLDSVIAEVTY